MPEQSLLADMAVPVALSLAQLSHAGGRQVNQDSWGSVLQEDLACVIVADGVGGQYGGEIASNIVVHSIMEMFVEEASFGPRALQSYIEHAVAQLNRRQAQIPRLKDMSSTVAVLLIDQTNRCALWGHMGDTRVYLFRRHKLLSATKDHSLIQQFVDAGHCSPEQLRRHPRRSILSAAVGVEGSAPAEVTQNAVQIQDGDAFLICSDGFWEWISEAEMEQAASQVTSQASSAQEWLDLMHAVVKKNGSASNIPLDNCTAFTIRVAEPRSSASR
ncbi:PP2C family protein-serine/threonine phosphatase [Collimonas fungivorans]|uniref:Protein serine/threonine phosphatase n=1 Tax=Collimonas fungivorans (strain Ter331) TaxID=1005048 RepID=G0AG75_COLFT|nr:protein phosphatase 2C domain-containing protein [Collimonas fungivorans]AEK59966.1 protein serine/threonine phosphatase [Collimonas fungivorans Ter331]